MRRHLLPRTLFGRSLLIVVTPIILLQLVLAYVFFESHWDTVSRRLALGLVGDISLVIQTLNEAQDEMGTARALTMARRHFGLDISVEPGQTLSPYDPAGAPTFSILDRMLNKAISERLFRPYTFDTRRSDNTVEILVQLPDGVLRVLTPRKRLDSTTTRLFVMWMIGTSLVLVAIAVVFLRNQMRPVRALARAADAFGKGRDAGPIKPSGATEVRQATRSFIAMRERMKRQITQHTEMLAGVSHDLRTPLTRMKLELEMLEGKADVSSLQADVRDMETMVEGFLAFARGQDSEQAVATDLHDLLAGVVDDARRQGREVDFEAAQGLVVPVRPNAFRRCITNLLDNASRYAGTGGGQISVRARRLDESVEIAIDDRGPGIPRDKREAAFKPFHRLDESRNPEISGVGLGLTIARDIARGHGGDLVLEDRPQGGLRALVTLPV